MTAAVQPSEIAAVARNVHQALLALREAEEREQRVTKNLETARDVTARRRLELGRELVRARAFWPARGPKAKGWGDFLVKLGIEQQRAWEHMKLAGYVEEVSPPGGEIERVPTLAEAGAKAAPHLRLVPTADEDESDGPALDFEVPKETEIDRDTWCTPLWIADAIGKFDLDPCSNDRSHIKSKHTFRLDRGEDGLKLAHEVPKSWRVFINPPYSDVMPWIEAYRHTRFCFLLKLDFSTKWFKELQKHTRLFAGPKLTRVEFEAPPGVPKDMQNANPFPHVLFYAYEEDATAAIWDRCYTWRHARD